MHLDLACARALAAWGEAGRAGGLHAADARAAGVAAVAKQRRGCTQVHVLQRHACTQVKPSNTTAAPMLRTWTLSVNRDSAQSQPNANNKS